MLETIGATKFNNVVLPTSYPNKNFKEKETPYPSNVAQVKRSNLTLTELNLASFS